MQVVVLLVGAAVPMREHCIVWNGYTGETVVFFAIEAPYLASGNYLTLLLRVSGGDEGCEM